MEQRRPTQRRFGPEADARWKAFRGDLGASARIDLLIRDADAEWPGAFGARTVYGLEAVAEDEAFGAGWEPLHDVDAEELWRSMIADAPPTTPRAVFEAVAAAWEIALSEHPVSAPKPSDHFLVVGPSAIAALATAFAQGSDLDWSEQVTVLASPAAHRHIAAAAAAVVNVNKPTRLLDQATEPTAAHTHAATVLIASADAHPDDRARAAALVPA